MRIILVLALLTPPVSHAMSCAAIVKGQWFRKKELTPERLEVLEGRSVQIVEKNGRALHEGLLTASGRNDRSVFLRLLDPHTGSFTIYEYEISSRHGLQRFHVESDRPALIADRDAEFAADRVPLSTEVVTGIAPGTRARLIYVLEDNRSFSEVLGEIYFPSEDEQIRAVLAGRSAKVRVRTPGGDRLVDVLRLVRLYRL